MTGTKLRRRHRAGALAIAAMLLAAAASFVVVQQSVASSDAGMQALADEAALAGVNALASTEGQTDAMRIEAAQAAVHKVVAARSELKPIIAPSIEEMKMSVTLASNASGRGPALIATARYVAAGSAVSPGPTADALAKKRTRS